MEVLKCAVCRHFRADIRSKNICTAFPAGIPSAIAFGDVTHREPYPGDNGIQWEPAEGMEFLDVPPDAVAFEQLLEKEEEKARG
jgi:hypothetical protein